MNCLFGNNSCTWVLILVIVYLISQKCCGTETESGCGCGCNNSCGGYNGCGCGCN